MAIHRDRLNRKSFSKNHKTNLLHSINTGDPFTIQERSDNQASKRQLNSIVDTAFETFRDTIAKKDDINWYCSLRQNQNHDHDYDGIRDLQSKNAGRHKSFNAL